MKTARAHVQVDRAVETSRDPRAQAETSGLSAIARHKRDDARISPHGPLTRLAEDVYCVEADAQSLSRPRRMTIVVLPGRRLLIHSGVRLTDDEMAGIDALGRVAYYLFVPNAFHDPDAAWFAKRYPDARVIAPAAAVKRLRKTMRVDAAIEEGWPAQCANTIVAHSIGGVRFPETVLFHIPSRTLVVVDLVFNMTERYFKGRPLGRLLMKLNHAYDRFGITRLTEMLVHDPMAFRASLELVLAWDFDRVVVSHGSVLESGGKEAMKRAFVNYLS
jgi:hypothetical protein